MSRVATDIAILQRAADSAALVLKPGAETRTFGKGNITIGMHTLYAVMLELGQLRQMPCEYRVIDYPAIWLVTCARQLLIHQLDNAEPQVARYQRLGDILAEMVAADLADARIFAGEP